MAADRLRSDVHMMNNADNYITSLAPCNNGTVVRKERKEGVIKDEETFSN